jgi:DNA polymerase-3 subunit delta'
MAGGLATGWRTRGQDVAVEAVRRSIAVGAMPHALLLAGPPGAGKTTLALDIAAALLCDAADPAARPCRACRGCRMVDHANHPDLHRLRPGGAGGGIGIGGPDRAPGVRDLVTELAYLPVEGGARVAIVESADRLTDDAQSAFLKTLEEPPAGAVIILCADEEDRLLPTIRSRCARIRLGPVATRTIEAILAERGVADPPTAARLAVLASGRPGIALAYAMAPEATTIRSEIARRLLDLGEQGRAARLIAIRELLARSADMLRAMDGGEGPAGGGRGRAREREPANPPSEDDVVPARAPAAERRRAALALVGIWRDVVRDLALVERAAPGAIRDVELLDELESVVNRGVPAPGAFMARLARAGQLLEGNVGPELMLDVLALAWGRLA